MLMRARCGNATIVARLLGAQVTYAGLEPACFDHGTNQGTDLTKSDAMSATTDLLFKNNP